MYFWQEKQEKFVGKSKDFPNIFKIFSKTLKNPQIFRVKTVQIYSVWTHMFYKVEKCPRPQCRFSQSCFVYTGIYLCVCVWVCTMKELENFLFCIGVACMEIMKKVLCSWEWVIKYKTFSLVLTVVWAQTVTKIRRWLK